MLEGQNFNASIFDTQDLSTIRGGSLLLRDLVTTAEGLLQTRFPGAVTRASIGGSIGIWRIRADAADVARAVDALRADLDADAGKHLGFGLAAVEDDGLGYNRQRKRLRAILQHHRLTESRLPYPSLTDTLPEVCPVDLVRPVGQKTHQRIGPKGTPGSVIETSTSVRDRRKHGIIQKQKLIAQETKRASVKLSERAQQAVDFDEKAKRQKWPFAIQIASIAEQGKVWDVAGTALGTLRSNLADKICVIALDGNGFSQVQDEQLSKDDTIDTQIKFDETLGGLRSNLIATVFNEVIEKGGMGRPTQEEIAIREDLRLDPVPDEVVRFELLLWGGDEIMFIVPARLGWDVLKVIAAYGKPEDFYKKKPTFSVGAVFCHATAPIARVKSLADELTNHIKRLEPKDGYSRDGKADTLVMVEVLESFDHVGLDLSGHLAKRAPKPKKGDYPASAIAAARVLDRTELAALQGVAQALDSRTDHDLSRGRLRQTAFALHRAAAPGADFRGDNWVNYVAGSAVKLKDIAAAPLSSAAASFAGIYADEQQLKVDPEPEDSIRRFYQRGRLFTLLNEYWDYLVPVRAEEPPT